MRYPRLPSLHSEGRYSCSYGRTAHLLPALVIILHLEPCIESITVCRRSTKVGTGGTKYYRRIIRILRSSGDTSRHAGYIHVLQHGAQDRTLSDSSLYRIGATQHLTTIDVVTSGHGNVRTLSRGGSLLFSLTILIIQNEYN